MSYVKRFSSNPQIRAILRDGGALLSGNAFASILGFISVAVVTRVISAEGLGLLILSQTVIRLAAAALLPKPWQTLVRYGAQYKANSELRKLNDLLMLGLLVEIGAAIIAYLFVRIGLVVWQGFGVNDPVLYQGILIYSTTLLFEITGFSTAAYRLFRRYQLQAVILGLNALLNFGLIIVAYAVNADVTGFVWAYAIARILGTLITLGVAAYVLSSEGLLWKERISLQSLKSFRHTYSFGISMHMTDIVGTVMREIDYLVIAMFLGPAGVGVMKIIKQFGRPFSLLADPVKQVIYPEACEIYSVNSVQAMVKYLLRASILLAVVLVPILALLMLLTPTILRFAFGSEYVTYAGLAILYTAIHVGFLLAQGLPVSALALGQATPVFYSYLVMNIVYVAAIFVLAPVFDLAGIILAFATGSIVWVLWLLEVNRSALKREGAKLGLISRLKQVTPE